MVHPEILDVSEPQSKSDRESFVADLTQHHAELLGFIYSLVGNWQDAQDVLQQTSMVLWRKYDQFDPSTNFMDWATRVAFYEAKNFIRLIARDRHYFNDELLRQIAAERARDVGHCHSRAAALESCLSKLRAEDRDLLDQVYDGRKAVGDIASDIGVAIQSVYNRLYRLRKRLADCVHETLAAEAGTS